MSSHLHGNTHALLPPKEPQRGSGISPPTRRAQMAGPGFIQGLSTSKARPKALLQGGEKQTSFFKEMEREKWGGAGGGGKRI